MVHIVAINGAGTSGKDLFIDQFEAVCQERDPSIKIGRFSSVDLIYGYARQLGWDGVKDDKGRRLLSDLKSALARYNDLPYQYMEGKIKDFCSDCPGEGVIFLHIREPQEIKRLAEEYGHDVTSLLITRRGVNPGDFTNDSDRGVMRYPYNCITSNDGTVRDLKSSARMFYDILEVRRKMPNARIKAEF